MVISCLCLWFHLALPSSMVSGSLVPPRKLVAVAPPLSPVPSMPHGLLGSSAPPGSPSPVALSVIPRVSTSKFSPWLLPSSTLPLGLVLTLPAPGLQLAPPALYSLMDCIICPGLFLFFCGSTSPSRAPTLLVFFGLFLGHKGVHFPEGVNCYKFDWFCSVFPVT